MMKNKQISSGLQLAAPLLVLALLTGCFRGLPSDKAPVHINPNMDSQEKYKAQAEGKFFADGSAMRLPVPGTVAIGTLRHDSAYFFGIDSRGDTVESNPMEVTMELLERGQERYSIYCAPCHGASGDGQGAVFLRDKGMLPPSNYHEDRLRNAPDGHIFSVISNGIRNMPAYKYQIPVADRWAIVSYFRALQRSQNATLEDVPENQRGSLR
jgi:hypothetical protein